MALDYAEIENYKRAKIEAEMVLKTDKNNLWAYQYLLQISEKEHKWDEAKRLAEKIQKLSGTKDVRQLSKIHLQAGIEDIESGDNKKALQNLNKAIKT